MATLPWGLVRCITNTENRTTYENGRLNHLVCGDFNPTEWMKSFEEWVSHSGAWELSDPAVPTYTTENTLGRILLLPGSRVFDALLPPAPDAGLDASGDFDLDFFPAQVWPDHPTSAHSPASVDLSFCVEEAGRRVATLKVQSVAKEAWDCTHREKLAT